MLSRGNITGQGKFGGFSDHKILSFILEDDGKPGGFQGTEWSKSGWEVEVAVAQDSKRTIFTQKVIIVPCIWTNQSWGVFFNSKSLLYSVIYFQIFLCWSLALYNHIILSLQIVIICYTGRLEIFSTRKFVVTTIYTFDTFDMPNFPFTSLQILLLLTCWRFFSDKFL